MSVPILNAAGQTMVNARDVVNSKLTDFYEQLYFQLVVGIAKESIRLGLKDRTPDSITKQADEIAMAAARRLVSKMARASENAQQEQQEGQSEQPSQQQQDQSGREDIPKDELLGDPAGVVSE